MRAAPLSAALLPLALAACGAAPKPGPPQADTATADDGAADGTDEGGADDGADDDGAGDGVDGADCADGATDTGDWHIEWHIEEDEDGDGTPNPLDCAPFDPRVAAGATEVCGDGVVNDCDRRAAGWSDELCAVQSEALIEIIKPTSYVAEAASLGDMMGDGGFYMGIGIPSATRCDVIGVDEWGADVYDCYRIGGFYMLELAALRPSSHGNELWLPRPDAPGVFGVDGHLRDRNYGSSLEGLGDLDGDGYADFIVGNDQPGRGAETDEVWLFWGPGLPDRFDEGTQLLLGDDPGRCIGYDMERAGDLTGDGVDDLVVGDPCRDEAWVWSGADVVAGATGADLSPAARIVDSSAEAIELGMGLSGRSDLTGDGVADLVVSAPNARRTIGGADLDYVGVYAGPFAGDRAAEDRAATVRTSLVMADYSEHALGCTVDVGDLNGDGYFDLVVGDPMWSDDHTQPKAGGRRGAGTAPLDAQLRAGDLALVRSNHAPRSAQRRCLDDQHRRSPPEPALRQYSHCVYGAPRPQHPGDDGHRRCDRGLLSGSSESPRHRRSAHRPAPQRDLAARHGGVQGG
jgi:hypothetical protein